MKLVTANGKQTVKMSKKEWQDIGKKAGWNDTPDQDLSSRKQTLEKNIQELEGQENTHSNLQIGDKVQIKDTGSPFLNFHGIISDAKNGEFQVTIEIFGKKAILPFKADSIKLWSDELSKLHSEWGDINFEQEVRLPQG